MKKIKAVGNNLRAKLIAMVFFYLQDIVLARMLGIEDYAEWAYYFSIMTIMFWVSNFGISNAIQVIVAKDDEDYRKINAHIKSGMVLRILVSAVFGVMIILLSRPLCSVSGVIGKYSHLSSLLVIGTVYLFCYSIVEFWKSTYIGLKRTDNLFILTLFEHSGYFLWSIVGFCFFKNIYGVVVGYVVSYGISILVAMKLYINKNYCASSLSKSEMKKYIGDVFKIASTYIIACLSAFIMLEMDTVMLGSLQSDKVELALYVIAKKITSKAPNLNEALLIALMVEFAVISEINISEKRKLFKKIFAVNLGITIIVSIGLVLFGKVPISILYGREYIDAYRYLLVLVLNYMIAGINQMFISFLYYRNCAGYVSTTYAISVISNLVLNSLLIPRYGAMGAGWATVISMLPFITLLGYKCKKLLDSIESL